MKLFYTYLVCLVQVLALVLIACILIGCAFAHVSRGTLGHQIGSTWSTRTQSLSFSAAPAGATAFGPKLR